MCLLQRLLKASSSLSPDEKWVNLSQISIRMVNSRPNVWAQERRRDSADVPWSPLLAQALSIAPSSSWSLKLEAKQTVGWALVRKRQSDALVEIKSLTELPPRNHI